MLDCDCCGAVIVGEHPTYGMYLDAEIVLCAECGAINQISVDEDGGDAWVSSWQCRHGVDSDESCVECDNESTAEESR